MGNNVAFQFLLHRFRNQRNVDEFDRRRGEQRADSEHDSRESWYTAAYVLPSCRSDSIQLFSWLLAQSILGEFFRVTRPPWTTPDDFEWICLRGRCKSLKLDRLVDWSPKITGSPQEKSTLILPAQRTMHIKYWCADCYIVEIG
jgi:hypothetical protein